MTKRSYAWKMRQGFGLSARDTIRPKYNRELWLPGQVRDEARRLAKLEIEADYRKRGLDPRDIPRKAMDNAVTVLLFNSEDVLLKRAKFNLGGRK